MAEKTDGDYSSHDPIWSTQLTCLMFFVLFFSGMFSIDVRALKFNDASFPFKLTMYFTKWAPKCASILGSLKQCVIVDLLSLDECMLFRQATIERKE